jgi:hypothetical protein
MAQLLLMEAFKKQLVYGGSRSLFVYWFSK